MNDQPPDLTLRNGRVVTPAGVVRGGLTVTGGVITSVAEDHLLPTGEQTVDVAGKVIFPGLIDPHTHMGVGAGWGPEKFESDIATESIDALAGGITTIITTSVFGPTPRVPMVQANIDSGNRSSRTDFRVTALMVTREQMDEIPDLVSLGVRSFKCYWGYKGPQAESFGLSAIGFPTDLFWVACEKMKAAHPRAFPTIHAEDPDLRYLLIERWRAKDPVGSLASWARANPNILEPLQLAPAARIAHEIGVPLYMVHVSTHEAAEMIREFREKGWNIVGDTLTAFLYWTADEADARGVGGKGKVQPAIKFAEDRDALWAAIRDNVIPCIGTDSLMYQAETLEGNIWDKQVGLGPGLGTSLAAIVTSGLRQGRITLEQMARSMSENAARQFDLYPTKGALQPGADADIVVFDPDAGRIARAEELPSDSKYTIFEGEELFGWPDRVYLRGQLAVENGHVVANPPRGKYVPAVPAPAEQESVAT
jgi:dihydroorotase-like cyclic amidohydrolase